MPVSKVYYHIKMLFVFCVLSYSMFCCSDSKETGIIGVWSWSELSYHDKDTSYVWNDIDGQLIFTEKHYSFIHVYKSHPRDTLPDFHSGTTYFDKLDMAGLREVFYPVVAHSGEYKIKDDSILFYRAVAIWPNAMDLNNQPKKMPAPGISGDSLIFLNGPFKNIWVRRE
jgi:hypothetical protein